MPVQYGIHTTESPFWRARSAPRNQTLPKSADHLAQKHRRPCSKAPMTDPAGGMDWQAKRLEGKVFTVRFIDSAGQIHLEETGLALIPGVDEYEIVK